MNDFKKMPNSLTCEQTILASIMFDFSFVDEVSQVITKNDFFNRVNGVLFDECVKFGKKHPDSDIEMFIEYLISTQKIDSVGGNDYLHDVLAKNSVSKVNTLTRCNDLRRLSVCRQLIKTCQDITDKAFSPNDEDANDILDFAESKIMLVQDAITTSNKQEPRVFKDVARSVLESIQERYNNGGQITGMPTGFYDLDEMILGLQKKTLVIVAGRPAMGKTTFAMDIAKNITKKLANDGDFKTAGLIFSLEMSDESLVEKMIASLGRIDCHKMRKGDMEETDFNKLANTVGNSKDWPLYIDQTPAITIHDIRAKARRIHKKHGSLAYVVIDYLQLIAPSQKGFSRENEIAEISRALKALSKELDCPVIALSQLSRNVEQRANKRPVLSDLRESGQIEQDADLIVFVYRDEYYNIESKDKGIAELIVAKQRQGNVGVIRVAANLHQSRFDNLAKHG
ncbi:MAG TPA: replicative DNA helicase [Agitococcus sp.]|nr:replicative DNA helicase [Agitococcus sp.]